MTEDEVRDLLGYGGPPEVSFAGQQWKIHAEGLLPLLRFARTPHTDDGSHELAALHRLLEDCIIDFTGFSLAATAAKADAEQIKAVTMQLSEFYCCRGHWPAMRLLATLAASFGEIDGMLLRASGRGVASLSAREACDLVLVVCLDGREGDDREDFLYDLDYEGDADAEALEQVRLMREARAEAEEVAGG